MSTKLSTEPVLECLALGAGKTKPLDEDGVVSEDLRFQDGSDGWKRAAGDSEGRGEFSAEVLESPCVATKYNGIVSWPLKHMSPDRDLARRALDADVSRFSSSIESFRRGELVGRLKRRGTEVVEAARCDSRAGLCGVVGTSAAGDPGRESGWSGRSESDPTAIGDVGRVSVGTGRSLGGPISIGDVRVSGMTGTSLSDPISISDDGRVSRRAGGSITEPTSIGDAGWVPWRRGICTTDPTSIGDDGRVSGGGRSVKWSDALG